MPKSSQPESNIREIYAAYCHRMLLWAKRYFPEQADCEDAVHEAFLRLMKRPDLVEQAGRGARLEGLCRIVLRSACLDQLKKTQREIPVEEELVAATEDPRESRTEEHFAEQDALRQAIARLPQEVRDMLILAYLYGYSAGEIAKFTGKKEGAVRKALLRGKKSLYALLKEEEL